jgi:hypothetical protein
MRLDDLVGRHVAHNLAPLVGVNFAPRCRDDTCEQQLEPAVFRRIGYPVRAHPLQFRAINDLSFVAHREDSTAKRRVAGFGALVFGVTISSSTSSSGSGRRRLLNFDD